jgi:hypothetical protein
MAESPARIRVLVIQFWILDATPIRAALVDAGFDVALTRVDIEPALRAALSWGRPDVVIFDASTNTISRDSAIECVRAMRRDLDVVQLDDLVTLGSRVHAALRARRS